MPIREPVTSLDMRVKLNQHQRYIGQGSRRIEAISQVLSCDWNQELVNGILLAYDCSCLVPVCVCRRDNRERGANLRRAQRCEVDDAAECHWLCREGAVSCEAQSEDRPSKTGQTVRTTVRSLVAAIGDCHATQIRPRVRGAV